MIKSQKIVDRSNTNLSIFHLVKVRKTHYFLKYQSGKSKVYVLKLYSSNLNYVFLAHDKW